MPGSFYSIHEVANQLNCDPKEILLVPRHTIEQLHYSSAGSADAAGPTFKRRNIDNESFVGQNMTGGMAETYMAQSLDDLAILHLVLRKFFGPIIDGFSRSEEFSTDRYGNPVQIRESRLPARWPEHASTVP